jgi:signal transduction histidine kinase
VVKSTSFYEYEIRTPMNGILGFTELLQEPQLTGKKQQKYQIIEKVVNGC